MTERAAEGIISIYLLPYGGKCCETMYGRGESASQINAAKSALNGCGKVVLEGHIQHCVREGLEHGDAEKTIESFTKAVERFANMQ